MDVASGVLGALPPGEVPVPLRRVARFEPRRRAKLAATQIATQLENDAVFRERVAQGARTAWAELAGALDDGTVPPAADPATLAAAAYLIRPDGWTDIVASASAELDRSAAVAAEAATAQTIESMRGKLTETKRVAEVETARVRTQLRAARDEIKELRHKLHETRERARSATERATEAQAAAEAERTAAKGRVAAADKELRQARAELAEARERAETARRTTRESRNAADARLHMLLDILGDATQGLRRELALPTSIELPADTVAAVRPSGTGIGTQRGRALSDQDQALFDQLLALPRVHLVIDGYNVTKTGYPALPLADQRLRLINGLSGLAARTHAEVTCVFDGADVDAPASKAPRGVRVLFSEPGETADELIVRLVAAEPSGRSVVVVTSDQEIIDAIRRAGAQSAPSALLLSRLRH